VIQSKRDLQFNYLQVDFNTLSEILKNIDKYYSHFSEPKYNNDGSQKMKNGIPQTRPFHSPNATLRKIQKSILRKILEKIPLPTYVIGGTKKRSSTINAALHKGKNYRFQTDLSNFFPSVSANMVYKMFRTYNFSHDIADILTTLTTLKAPEAIRGDCLPQGTSTSPYIANLVFHQIDLQIMEIVEKRELTYTRYIDDLTFSCSNCFQEAVPEIIKIINSNGFMISRRKTTYKCGRTIITGVDVGNNTIRPTQEFYDKGALPLNEAQKRGRTLYIENVKKYNKTKTKSIIQKISANT
jgi:RNA-directed DNA polymerase